MAGVARVPRPGPLLQEVSSRQRAATRHQDHCDPPAKRWMKFSSSLNYANFCTQQHSPTSWNCSDFIPYIPSSKYRILELLALARHQKRLMPYIRTIYRESQTFIWCMVMPFNILPFTVYHSMTSWPKYSSENSIHTPRWNLTPNKPIINLFVSHPKSRFVDFLQSF